MVSRAAALSLLIALACAACVGDIGADDGVDAAAGPDGGDDGAAPPDADSTDAAPPGDLLGSFQLTYYWVAYEGDFSGVPDTSIYDSDCNVLATVPADFADSLALEGTGRLLDGRVLNYWGSCACAFSPCFFEVDAEHPWGVGVQNRALIPFRSVAVDSDVIAYGSTLYAPDLDGVLMPGDAPWGDFIHDGCLSADDTGGAIIGMHIDFFSALRDYYVDINGELGLSDITLYDGGARCAE
jgi:3D (Asp-Asp-Asp) domain-containing protein